MRSPQCRQPRGTTREAGGAGRRAEYDYSVAQHVDGRGRTVLQFTSSRYHTLAGGGANVKFIATITDDKGNPLTLSNQATVKHLDAPKVELPH